MPNRSNNVALVTGGSRGIGAATAILLAKSGYDVVINYKTNESRALVVKESVEALGQRAIVVQADISNKHDVIHLFETCDSFGQLTLLVNNAGVLETQSKLIDMSLGRLQRILNTNVIGTMLCCQEAIRRMSVLNKGEGGSIVNVSSGAARLGSANEYVDYAASKGAVDTLTIGLANEVADEGIRVNCVRPGLIYTEMHSDGGEPGRVDRLKENLPLKRGGKPEEVAAAIVFFASTESAYTTGAFLDVTGGR
jgi:NAD(P)-dependent dehydrogenase (short-subunit alcohol dehydrogenase family)